MQHIDVLRETVAGEDGAVVKAMGDAIMAVFTRPAAALRAGLAAQRAIAGRFGSTVNLAARLVSLSTGADIVVSGDVLADPEVEKLGLRREAVEARLKGFERSFELWRVRA